LLCIWVPTNLYFDGSAAVMPTIPRIQRYLAGSDFYLTFLHCLSYVWVQEDLMTVLGAVFNGVRCHS
jgi:hypothetical protein